MRCQICDGSETSMFLSLGEQPLSDAFLKPENVHKPEPKFPLDLLFCQNCTLVQLGYAVDPDLMFRDYVYTTGTNAYLRTSFKELVDDAVKTYALKNKDLAVDIGSNDGTLLQNYLPHGLTILGIDPSSVAAEAKEKGIPTIVDYFTEEVAHDARNVHGRAKIITATNVFAHVRELDSLMRGISTLLDDTGVFITESGYVLDMIENTEYDCIYHEHLRYYSVTALASLFERFGMEIISVKRTKGSSGGSIRVTVSKKGAYPPDETVTALLSLEKEKGLLTLQTYQTFAGHVAEIKTKLLEILAQEKARGARIVGVGAPAKGNTLLNYCGVGTDTLEYLAETSPLKIGLYSPGMHIPVVDEERMFKEQPDAALLLAWNYASILMPKLRARGFRGRFIIPNPVPRIE